MLGPSAAQAPMAEILYCGSLNLVIVASIIVVAVVVAISLAFGFATMTIYTMDLSADFARWIGRGVDIYVCGVGGQCGHNAIEVEREDALCGGLRGHIVRVERPGHRHCCSRGNRADWGYGGRHRRGSGGWGYTEVHHDPAGHVLLAEVDVGL